MSGIKTYDEDVVLEKAMRVFWDHGYNATSVRMLEKELGGNMSYLFCAGRLSFN